MANTTRKSSDPKMDRFNRAQHQKEWDKRHIMHPSQRRRTDECVTLGACGYHSSFIARKTGISEGQVCYRLKQAGISRYEIRNGNGPWSKLMLRTVHDTMEAQVVNHLEKTLGY